MTAIAYFHLACACLSRSSWLPRLVSRTPPPPPRPGIRVVCDDRVVLQRRVCVPGSQYFADRGDTDAAPHVGVVFDDVDVQPRVRALSPLYAISMGEESCCFGIYAMVIHSIIIITGGHSK